MNYTESVQYLYSLGHETAALKLALESIRTLCQALDNPQQKFPAIHIAGTNGKGSTAAMTEAITLVSRLKTGLYTSPHLIEITERIRVNGDEIKSDDFARMATQVRAISESLVREGALPAPPTFFEQVTAIAFLYFVECGVDLAILEVGLGGRLDATNVCEPIVCAITTIDYDHQTWLGKTIPEIAAEKGGIIKSSAPVILSPQEHPAEVLQVISERCLQHNAPLINATTFEHQPEATSDEAGRYSFRWKTEADEYDVSLNLRGRHQVINACTAILIAEQLQRHGFPVTKSEIVTGLHQVNWSGRLEFFSLPDGTKLLLDGAHNPSGARVLKQYLEQHCQPPITMIFGVMSDKALHEIADTLFEKADTIIATHINNPRATDPKVIAATYQGRRAIEIAESSKAALQAALQQAGTGGTICVCGSLYLIGEVEKELREGLLAT